MEHCHSRQSAIRVRAGSFSFCILRNNCGPAYCRDHTGRPALISRCGQINRAARAARLPHTVVERLRWKKIKRVPADIADAIREAVERHNEESLSRAKHEAFMARQQAAVLAARLSEIDPDFYRPDIDRLGFGDRGGRDEADHMGGE